MKKLVAVIITISSLFAQNKDDGFDRIYLGSGGNALGKYYGLTDKGDVRIIKKGTTKLLQNPYYFTKILFNLVGPSTIKGP